MFKMAKAIIKNSLYKTRLNSVTAVNVNEVEKYYDDTSERYVESYGKIIQAARPTSDDEYINYLVDSIGIQDGQKLLDAGCGVCGPSVLFAQKKEITIEAVTISGEQVRMSKENVSKASLQNKISVKKADFHYLSKEFAPNTFDTVFFLETLGYAKNIDQVLLGVFTVLKPNGSLYIKDFFPVPLLYVHQKDRQIQITNEIRQEYRYKLLNLVKLIEATRKYGFFLTYARPLNTPEDFTNASNFELGGGHGSYTKAITSPYQLFEILELKFRKVLQ